jgi:predicted nucleic acid-binding protein
LKREKNQIPISGTVIEKAAQWGFMLAKKGKKVPTTDLFIASAADGKAIVLHVDSDFETIASITGVAQEKIALTS